MQHMPPTDGGFTYELTLSLIEMLGLKYFEEAIVLYGLHSPFVKEMLNSCAMQSTVILSRLEKIGVSCFRS